MGIALWPCSIGSHLQMALVLLDLRLPDTQGLTGLETLAAHHRGIPRVVLSGDDPTLASRMRAAGTSSFEHKSADVRALFAPLTQVLEGHMVFEAAIEKRAAALARNLMLMVKPFQPARLRAALNATLAARSAQLT